VVECVSPYTVWVCVSCVGVEEILCGVTLTPRESSSGFNPSPGGTFWSGLTWPLRSGISRSPGNSYPPSTVSTLSTTIKTRRRGCFVRLRQCLSITRSQPWWFGCFEWSRGRGFTLFWHGLWVVNCWWTQCPGGGGGVGTVGSIKNTNVVSRLLDWYLRNYPGFDGTVSLLTRFSWKHIN
jgi:hypothetical protein